MTSYVFKLNPVVPAHIVSDLRETVGWDRLAPPEQAELTGYWATVGGFDQQDTLIAWCALLSDGRQHGILLDVIVHPHWQRKGVGRALVTRAIEQFHAHKISIIHVDFLPEHAQFYQRCGFSIGLGGIYERVF